MKIYKLTCDHADHGAMLSWYSSRTNAAKAWAEHKKAREGPADGPEGIEEIEFPTTMAPLLSWLNTHFDRDNG